MLTLEQQNYAYNAYEQTMKYLSKPKSLLHPEFSSNCAMYTFTTENLVGYMKKLKAKDKTVLTVTGSGDQLINLALLGAKRVDNFDVNQNAYFITELKLAALQVLSYDEFLDFFCLYEYLDVGHVGIVYCQKPVGKNHSVFDYKTYLRIKPFLKDVCAFYWDLVYEEFQFDGKRLANSQLFFDSDRKTALSNNLYLQNEDEYNKAREKIKDVEVNYVECNLLDVHNLPGTYDIMLFSNVYDYLTDEWYNIINEDLFVQYVEDKVSQRLNDGGTVAVAYQYNYKIKNYTDRSLISKILGSNYTFDKRAPLERLKRVVVTSTVKEYRKDGGKDCVYLYQKAI